MMLLPEMIAHRQITSRDLHERMATGSITLGGNEKHKIYGLLSCSAGKRMQKKNRVFFVNEKEALSEGYRPCGHCLPDKYKAWKNGII